jgi:NAD(P)H-dependent FMN reductase
MARLGIITGSTRPGRRGPAVARWVESRAEQHGSFEIELLDLAAWGLPLLDEPNHPKLRRYVHAHTHAWSETVDRQDAFVFVTPEYNHGPSAALKNAIDFLLEEWRYKPAAFVGYGGSAGGARAVQVLRQVAVAVKMSPVFEAVYLHRISDRLDSGVLRVEPHHEAACTAMLDEVARMHDALRGLRLAA